MDIGKKSIINYLVEISSRARNYYDGILETSEIFIGRRLYRWDRLEIAWAIIKLFIESLDGNLIDDEHSIL